ncbi:MAG: phosphoglucosamine mutase [Candidatus Margulisiibacteriota bacterium]|nr:phosphoglucosamine mutase [Candidatus Margulisiibacteriota bacterium]
MSKLMLSSSGLRGVVGDHLTTDLIDGFVRAYLAWLPEGKIVIGGDTRTSHDALTQLVASICQLCGRDVVIIGKVPTPTVQQMVRKNLAAGGFAITASHNPVIWNGIKIIDSSGSFLSSSAYSEFNNYYESKKVAPYVDWSKQGIRVVDDQALESHVEVIKSVLPVNKVKPLKVLIDVNHGAGKYADDILFKHLSHVTVDYLFDGNDGEFSHAPEPVTENLTDLCARMKEGDYDIGFAQDPDADRLVIVDENGRFIGEDYSLAFSMDYYLSQINQDSPNVVVNLSTSKIIEYIANKYNATLYQTKIGEPNVTAKMKETAATIGGEGNGGIILPDVGWGRDSLTGIVLSLLHLSESGKSVSQIIANYPAYVMVREKQPLESRADIQEKVERVANHFSNESINMDDGVKVSFENAWVHIRPSNTEPIIRIFAEALNQSDANSLVEKVKSL